jgi:hypothetical protein
VAGSIYPVAVTVFLVVAWLLCGIVAGALAASKGRSFPGFFAIGLLLSVIGVVIAAVIGPGEPRPPKGWGAATCPRCNTRQNVQRPDTQFDCWQCGTVVPVEW